MNLTTLDLGAWISICCGFTLLRSSVGPRRCGNSASSHRVVVGTLLMIAGLAALAVALIDHLVRGA